MTPRIPEREPRYLRLLMILLGSTTFFEGYDAAIAGVVLPDLARSLSVSEREVGTAIAVVGLGAFGALFVTAIGDRIGRRPLLIGTTLLYALFTGLTATAHGVVSFAAYQFFARIFLIAEYATAVTIAAEELPADRRGRAIGLLTALGAVGLVSVAALYLPLSKTSLGWRGLYLVGVIPLLIVAPLRMRLRETQRFLEWRARGERIARVPFRAVLRTQYRGQLLRLGGVFFFSHFALLSGMTWWTWYATRERGFTISLRNRFLIATSLLGILGYFAAGRLQDRIGRRPTGTIFFLAGTVSGVILFQVHDRKMMFASMVGAVFFGLGANPIIGALASELFPTEIRATSVAVVRSLFGTSGAILGPFVVGRLADRVHGPIGNVGDSVTLAALFFLPAVAFLRMLPETAGRELESIAPPVYEGSDALPVVVGADDAAPLH
ncbi:MAG: MFS transporter [Actinomycetota bacterium]